MFLNPINALGLNFNARSIQIINKVEKDLSEFFPKYHISQGSGANFKSVDIYDSKGFILQRYAFFNTVNGNIHSIAIYGQGLRKHYEIMNKSRYIFGLTISEIELVVENTSEPFVDVLIAPYE